MENQLELIVRESGLEPAKADVILQKFSNFFNLAADWQRKAETLLVTKEDQVTEMKMAREGRLFLKQKRIEVENTRKELKEQSLREGKAIDGVANVLKALIIPIEEYLEKQEKFAEILESNRREALRQTRIQELTQYGWVNSGIDVGMFEEKNYQYLLTAVRKEYEEHIAEEKRIEQEHIEKERKEAEERERIKAENIRLQKEAEAREKAMAEERRIQAAKLAEEQAKAKREAEAREKAEKELQAKRDAELRAKKEAEEKAEIERKAKAEAAAAPDKEKLLSMIDSIQMPNFEYKTAWGQNTEKVIREKFDGFKEWAAKVINTKQNSLNRDIL